MRVVFGCPRGMLLSFVVAGCSRDGPPRAAPTEPSSPPSAVSGPRVRVASSCTDYRFVLDDLDRFERALEDIDAGTDPEVAIGGYIAHGSAGLQAWVEMYNVDSKRFARTVTTHPKFFRALVAKRGQFEAALPGIACGYDALRRLVPGVFDDRGATYLFVTELAGGGSVREPGVLLAVDYFGYDDQLDLSEFPEGLIPNGQRSLARPSALTHTAVHEVVHYLQQREQGASRYAAMYANPARSTMLAHAIREGGADFVASLATGEQPERNAFARTSERVLFSEFATIIDANPDDHPGWFSGRSPENPAWPYQIGYAVGYLIVEEFYSQAPDKDAAVRAILSASDADELRAILAPYRKKTET